MLLILCYITIFMIIHDGSSSMKLIRSYTKYKSKTINMVYDSPKSNRNVFNRMLLNKLVFGSFSSSLIYPFIAKASNIIEPKLYQSSIINEPSDDFWYPPFMIGYWNTTMSFVGAKFTNKIPLDILSTNNNIPGFNKYSIIFLPELGKDIANMTMRYVQLDSHPREDHPFNIRNLITSFSSDTIVDDASYHFQKAPNWLYSPANQWTIRYHDKEGIGKVDLVTKKRSIRVFAGTIETIEFFNQVLIYIIV